MIKMPHVIPSYSRFPVTFVRGEGVTLWDDQGKSYLDFLSGIGVNNLGHCHPKVVAAIREQVGQLIHTCNLYRIPLQEEVAKALTESCFAEQVFFCNSGAEANEAAIKLARKTMHERKQSHRYEIITANNGFHGRTLATLTATAQDKVQRGFAPLPSGFKYVPFNNAQAVEQAVGEHTAAILVEPIQGESGVVIPDPDYLPALRDIADRHDLLLIFDEVQTGMGRTGRFWCHQHSGITPDIMTSAKALASGIPMGACLTTAKVATAFSPGSHGSTFGGNPLACSAALATLSVIGSDGFLQSVTAKGEYLLQGLKHITAKHKMVIDTRGCGLMAGIQLNSPAEETVSICLSRGLLVSCQMGTIVRMLPPLIVEREDIDRALTIFGDVLNDLF
ncbi:MAG: aspartate aminotransferase family protein [Magnetococcales bacterium]|nr:aspartate aminotransferase family protein [Magnetococcales bacterium]MBF0150877.1 aspartate aminotransferase family protein [Magnetococcales bacterium]MBF0172676.1 aspartate aminotransferase family protein [Magnetococcales bacterium]MBF0348031.1 aspartate aminotransferase family protein [Magnetococcales bacterium]MBF0629388.1 aspartate aminotransferase family protein [Magnetococcales bacterium]